MTARVTIGRRRRGCFLDRPNTLQELSHGRRLRGKDVANLLKTHDPRVRHAALQALARLSRVQQRVVTSHDYLHRQ